jgi:hypothetical protein
MNTDTINSLPGDIFKAYDTDFAIVTANEHTNQAQISLNGDPKRLVECPEGKILEDMRRREKVHSLTVVLRRVTQDLAVAASDGLNDREYIQKEIEGLCAKGSSVCYVVTHFNHWPAAELTVFIGGDCYRTGPEIKDLESVFERTRLLAHAMVRKAVMIFPDIPTLHGGKKGEWIILDKSGAKASGISDKTIVALGAVIIPEGIGFLNGYKEMRATETGIYDKFPTLNYMRPDTASPDVLSGPNWTLMCEIWRRRGISLSFVTCIPTEMGGPQRESSYPTAFGVVTTALRLREIRFPNSKLSESTFLMEAFGGVGSHAVRILLDAGATPQNIHVFDVDKSRCSAAEQLGVVVVKATASEFYRTLPSTSSFDVWINNGEGNNTTPEQVDKLLDRGVRVFCGAANNFLEVSSELESLDRIFRRDGIAWPDEATSGGGWTSAVIDVMTRAKGLRADSNETEDLIVNTIAARNRSLIDAVVDRAGGSSDGRLLWNAVQSIINERESQTISNQLPIKEIRRSADTTTWNLN